MKILVVEPKQTPVLREIDGSLEKMQEIVGGLIEPIYFDDGAIAIVNEEGKIDGLELNRPLYDEDGNIIDVLYGTFFICGADGENFGSIPPELEMKYYAKSRNPVVFLRIGEKLIGLDDYCYNDYMPLMDNTFWKDFSIAELYGIRAVKETAGRCFRSWKDSPDYMRELMFTVIGKARRYAGINDDLCNLYDAWFDKMYDYCKKHYTNGQLAEAMAVR